MLAKIIQIQLAEANEFEQLKCNCFDWFTSDEARSLLYSYTSSSLSAPLHPSF